MQTDVSNVLSDLITLSDSADQIIADSNFGNDQVGQWFSIIKETALGIAKGTYCRKSTVTEKSSVFDKDDLPSLVTLIKGKQNSHRVSALLAEVQKDNRVRLSHRKSRKSLRKIVLGRKSGNQWKISNRQSRTKSKENNQEDEEECKTPITKVKDKLLESQFKGIDRSTNKNLHRSYFAEIDSSSVKTSQVGFSTPINQSKEVLVPNTDKITPAAHSKLNPAVAATTVVKVEKKNVPFLSETPVHLNKFENAPSQLVKSNSGESKEDSKTESNDFLTPENKTITISSDSSADKSDYVTPITRSKRKSSVQHAQENAKKIKCSTSVTQANSIKNTKWDDNFTANNAFKKIKLGKDINPVIPNKNVQQQEHQSHPEKRILREIQKKEEKISQNTRKLQSLQKKKIEENKKAREKKMEKAQQQRMKIEKEKEERIRSRTQSRQENLQQTELTSKRVGQKKNEPVAVIKNPSKLQCEGKTEPPRKPLRSSYNRVKDPSPKETTNTKVFNNLNATYVHSPAEVQNSSTPPPKPSRNPKITKEASDGKKEGNPQKLPLSSTPATKKTESKTNVTMTPISNNAKKPNSYAMTPHESSFVSYDISEIKSDDSDEEEETSNNKPIPSWASGVNLRTALLKQHYTQINVDEIFGNYFEPPKLAEIMGMEKKHYNKRTSSAIWLDSPNRSRLC